MKNRPTTLEVLLALAGLAVGVPLVSFALLVVLPTLLYASGVVLLCVGLCQYAQRVIDKGWRGLWFDPMDPREEAEVSARVAIQAHHDHQRSCAYRGSWAADFAREMDAIEGRR